MDDSSQQQFNATGEARAFRLASSFYRAMPKVRSSYSESTSVWSVLALWALPMDYCQFYYESKLTIWSNLEWESRAWARKRDLFLDFLHRSIDYMISNRACQGLSRSFSKTCTTKSSRHQRYSLPSTDQMLQQYDRYSDLTEFGSATGHPNHDSLNNCRVMNTFAHRISLACA